MPKLLVQDTPHIDLPIEQTAGEIVVALQKKFAEQGYLRGLVEATLDQCVREETTTNEEILFTYLMDNWEHFFRGADMTAEALQEARLLVQECLHGKQEEIKSQLMGYLTNRVEVEFYDYAEDISIKVGKLLWQKGFRIWAGWPYSKVLKRLNHIHDKYVILFPYRKKYFFGLVERQKFFALGELWFHNSARSATSKHLVFEVPARWQVEKARQLAEEISSAFNVKVSLRLTGN